MAVSKNTYIKKIKANLKSLGTYRKEYDQLIEIYGGLLFQYDIFCERFEESGCLIETEYTNKAGATNMRKTPCYTAMESLRKDIAVYSDRLGLNPKTLRALEIESDKTSKLSKVLDKI